MGGILGLFAWLPIGEIPQRFDLRRRGWRLAPSARAETDPEAGIALAHCGAMDAASWTMLTELTGQRSRSRIVLLGVGAAGERARLLRAGFGDVLGNRLSLLELEARAARAAGQAAALPRSLAIGRLRLDLIAREGFVQERPLGLHPREFALLWRLAEAPGVPLSKALLVNEVWRRRHVPDTNSLAVHVSRLRAKLALAGLGALVQTSAAGGYMLAAPSEMPAIPLPRHDSRSDRHVIADEISQARRRPPLTADSSLARIVKPGMARKDAR